MLRNTVLNSDVFYYPLGNTPAVCLTADLPPDQGADVLLLGCGDARNVLFTAFADEGLGKGKKLDVTCCDIEPAVLARNVLLFTLLLDDYQCSQQSQIWNIYYHLKLDLPSLNLLHSQTTKLQRLTSSIETWRESRYAQSIRFCDERTLSKVKAVWKDFTTGSDLIASEQKDKDRLQKALEKAKKTKADARSGSVLTGFRSAAPLGGDALIDLPTLHTNFWEHGTTDQDAREAAHARFFNPSFASLTSNNQTLHYGTDPYLGFHLATAYASLTATSPLHANSTSDDSKELAAIACREQFYAWSGSFRKATSSGLQIRIFTGDALSFCLALRAIRESTSDRATPAYYDNWTLQPIKIDTREYSQDSISAPTRFDIIDTSNLVDHLGPLNVLVAVIPLQKIDMMSNIYTEMLVEADKDVESMVGNLLCGHLPTVSLLLGLTPIEYWTNNTCIASSDEVILASALKQSSGKDFGQYRTRFRWKRINAGVDSDAATTSDSRLQLDEKALSGLLANVYMSMFSNENISTVLAAAKMGGIGRHLYPCYHRASFCALLGILKATLEVDFAKVVSGLLKIVESDNSLMIGKSYFQELYLHLHLSEVFTMPSFAEGFERIVLPQPFNAFPSWRPLPPVMCITIKVPKRSVTYLLENMAGVGTPTLCATIESSIGAWSNLFAVVQVTTGNVTLDGERNTNECRISVEEETHDWTSALPVLVSFRVPTVVVLQEPKTAIVAFGLQVTTVTGAACAKILGPNLRIFETTIGDENSIYLTKDMPNAVDHRLEATSTTKELSQPVPGAMQSSVRTSVQMSADNLRITYLTKRVDFLSSKAQRKLGDKSSAVVVTQKSPLILSLNVGGRQHCWMEYPVPVSASRSKLRVARKSGYVEIISPVVHPLDHDRYVDFMLPMSLSKDHAYSNIPLNWNLSHVSLDRLPILDLGQTSALRWLNPHISMQMSSRERAIREAGMIPGSAQYIDRRVDFKDSLHSMFMYLSGTQGQRARMFGLSKAHAGGVHILILVSAMKLHLGDASAILDAAILPLTKDLITQKTRMAEFLGSLQSKEAAKDPLVAIKVSDAELTLWKQTLPAFVERCRTWKHRSGCEYRKYGQIPTEKGLEDGQSPLCSCGVGHIPDPKNFLKDCKFRHYSEILAKYATRAAISPCFAVPWVEDCFAGDLGNGKERGNLNTPATSGTQTNAGECCANCGNDQSMSASSQPLLRCGRCRKVKYCSADCQKADWKKHKISCQKV